MSGEIRMWELPAEPLDVTAVRDRAGYVWLKTGAPFGQHHRTAAVRQRRRTAAGRSRVPITACRGGEVSDTGKIDFTPIPIMITERDVERWCKGRTSPRDMAYKAVWQRLIAGKADSNVWRTVDAALDAYELAARDLGESR